MRHRIAWILLLGSSLVHGMEQGPAQKKRKVQRIPFATLPVNVHQCILSFLCHDIGSKGAAVVTWRNFTLVSKEWRHLATMWLLKIFNVTQEDYNAFDQMKALCGIAKYEMQEALRKGKISSIEPITQLKVQRFTQQGVLLALSTSSYLDTVIITPLGEFCLFAPMTGKKSDEHIMHILYQRLLKRLKLIFSGMSNRENQTGKKIKYYLTSLDEFRWREILWHPSDHIYLKQKLINILRKENREVLVYPRKGSKERDRKNLSLLRVEAIDGHPVQLSPFTKPTPDARWGARVRSIIWNIFSSQYRAHQLQRKKNSSRT